MSKLLEKDNALAQVMADIEKQTKIKMRVLPVNHVFNISFTSLK